jgi:hypothetical protein
MKQHRVAGAGGLCLITPTQPFPHRGGGLLPRFRPIRSRLLMAILLLAPTGLTCCGTMQSQATKIDDRTFKIEGPGVPGGAEAPNRRLAERICPGGYRVLDSQRFKDSGGDFGDSHDTHTNWTIRCL